MNRTEKFQSILPTFPLQFTVKAWKNRPPEADTRAHCLSKAGVCTLTFQWWKSVSKEFLRNCQPLQSCRAEAEVSYIFLKIETCQGSRPAVEDPKYQSFELICYIFQAKKADASAEILLSSVPGLFFVMLWNKVPLYEYSVTLQRIVINLYFQLGKKIFAKTFVK